jgi:bifunctional UDP-N-acetylglucosamine pyrophosphorylase/glucosamine-1-phosphate N-acetyltransferase
MTQKSTFNTIILAAGKGTRMKSQLPKVAIKTLKGPMISSVIKAALDSVNPDNFIIVTGYKSDVVESVIREDYQEAFSFNFALQEQQLGTGHATQIAVNKYKDFFKNHGATLILYGDTPLISPIILSSFLEFHNSNQNNFSIITSLADKDSAYGKIVRDENGNIEKIVEKKDCTPQQSSITEVNSGIYLIDNNFLLNSINLLNNSNAQNEFYLTDLVEIATKNNIHVSPFKVTDDSVLQGVNSLMELSFINKTIMKQKITELLNNGVQILDPDTTYIEDSVNIEVGSIIGPNTQIFGTTSIGANTKIEGTSYILNSTVGSNCTIKFGTRIEDSKLMDSVSVGPFANLRPGSVLEEQVRIGNFVETKNAHLKKGAKANHLTYLGDAEIGEDSNIGAGTITCNYDGIRKSKTTLGKSVFIGSNSSLVAPLTIGDNSTIGAGSVITKNVEENSLALTRAELRTKKGYKRT